MEELVKELKNKMPTIWQIGNSFFISYDCDPIAVEISRQLAIKLVRNGVRAHDVTDYGDIVGDYN